MELPVYVVLQKSNKVSDGTHVERAYVDNYHDCMANDCCGPDGTTSALGVYEHESDAIGHLDGIWMSSNRGITRRVVKATLIIK